MTKNKLPITGVLLTGGESRRMGTNKALLEVQGKPLIVRNLEVLSAVCADIRISSRDMTSYQGFGYPVIPDLIVGKGPLGGLYSVLQATDCDQLFLAACDMPCLQEDAIRFIYEEMADYDIIVAEVAGRIHPLHAFYHRRIAPLVEKNLYANKLRLTDLFGACRTKVLKVEQLENQEKKSLIARSVINVNTPEEFKAIGDK